jgi:competence protein ComEA
MARSGPAPLPPAPLSPAERSTGPLSPAPESMAPSFRPARRSTAAAAPAVDGLAVGGPAVGGPAVDGLAVGGLAVGGLAVGGLAVVPGAAPGPARPMVAPIVDEPAAVRPGGISLPLPVRSGGVDEPPPDRSVWPLYPTRRGQEAAWRALDEQTSPAAGSPSTVPGSDEEPPVPPPAPPGRSALGPFDPGRRGVRILAVVAAIVVLVAGYLAWRSRPHAQPAPPIGSAAPAAPVGSAAPTGLIVVAVQGRVTHPGLYRLPSGARVADALAAAGGAQPGVDLSFVNLARKLFDGELLVIGATPPPDQAGPAAPGGKVNLNTATLTQLDALPGIGPALAQRIIDYRTQHDGFRSVDDLRHVEGIGDAKFAQLKDLITV